MAKYDRKNVDEFVESVKAELNPDVIFSFVDSLLKQRGEFRRVMGKAGLKFNKLTSWEKSAVLFDLEQLVIDRLRFEAKKWATKAREEEEKGN
jgi:hypothetical protein